MGNQHSLAIVIPAYKSTFLSATLDSIAAQTCKDFTLYIGDDCSPNGIGEIVSQYKDRIPLVYKRFDENLGGRDLVAQWERCIDMTQDEEWIWLFSDDDVMEPKCVEGFMQLPEEIKQNYLVHFHVKVLDMQSKTKALAGYPFPQVLTAKQYLDGKLFGKEGNYYISFVVEFVFSRKLYEKCGGFQNFDLAWGSDFLTWVKMAGMCKGIYTVDGEKGGICWRKSNENISPNKSRSVMIRKLHALIENAVFIKEWLAGQGYRPSFSYTKFFWGVLLRNSHVLTKEDIQFLYVAYRKNLGYPFYACMALVAIKATSLFHRLSKK